MHVCYESRLLQCGLTTLETRRLRGDQIEVFKIVNGCEDVDKNLLFEMAILLNLLKYLIRVSYTQMRKLLDSR